MKWYSKNNPNVQEIVMCTVGSFDPITGFTVTLDEYDDIVGLLTLKELNKKRIKKNLASFLKKGQRLPLIVYRDGDDDGVITLSKKAVTDDQYKGFMEYYLFTDKLYTLSMKLEHLSSIPKEEWLQQFQDLVEVFLTSCEKGESLESHPYVICSKKCTVSQLELPEKYMTVLNSRHVNLFGIQVSNKINSFVVNTFAIEGTELVKTKLMAIIQAFQQEQKWTDQQLYDDNTRHNVTLVPIALPRFELHVSAYLFSEAQDISRTITSQIASAGFDYFKIVTE